MEYQQFVDDVTSCISFKVNKDYEIKVNRVLKNNNVELDGIVFFKAGGTISPNIYLNQYYHRYQEGEALEEIADDIIDTYESSMKEQAGEYRNLSFTFEQFKDNIIYRVVNYGRNKALLENVPHVRFLDLAITFHCLVKQDDTGIGTIRITNEHKELWEVSVKQLMHLAAENTERLFPVKVSTMEEVLADLFRNELRGSVPDIGDEELPFMDLEDCCDEEANEVETMLEDEYSEEVLETMFNDMMKEQRAPKMYILTNSTGINGATSLIYKDAIRNFANSKQCDFYILPSSIHEVILVPYEECISREELKEMVNEVNCTQVPPEEILSDRVYIYRRETNMIEI